MMGFTKIQYFSEVTAQDYIFFNESAIRPAVCRLERVHDWDGKKIVLEVEDKCTVTIDTYSKDTDYSNNATVMADCKDPTNWEKVWVDTAGAKVLTIKSKASKELTDSPLKCSVTISDPAGTDSSTDEDWIYSHEPEITMYPLIIEGTSANRVTKLHYNPLKCKLYGAPKVVTGELNGTAETGKSALELTVTKTTAQTIKCSFTFADISSTGADFSISKSENITLRTCADGYEDDVAKQTCNACGPGTYRNSTVSGCTHCPVDTYAPGYGAAKCLTCTGEVKGDRTKCHIVTVTTLCSKGQYNKTGDGCTDCPVGRYNKEQNNDNECKECALGTIADEIRSWTCRKCPAGTKEKDHKRCDDCPEGTYQASSGQDTCKQCEAGSVAVIAGSTTCRQCPPGSKAASDGTECILCEAGTYQTKPGKSTCEPCTGSTYSAHKGAEVCSVCPDISYEVDAKNTNCNFVETEKVACLSKDVPDYENSIGVLSFETTPPQTKSKAKCPYNPDSSATYFCKAGPNGWETLDVSACKSAVSGEVNSFAEQESVVTVDVMNELAGKADKIAPSDVEDMAKTLKSKVSNSVKDASTSTEKESLARSGLALISNISLSNSAAKSSDESRRNMVTATENIVDALLDDKDVEILGESFDVKIVRNNVEDSIKASDTVALSGLKSVGITMYKKNTLFKEPANETSSGGVVKSTKILGNVIGLKSKESFQVFKLSVQSDLTEDDSNSEKYVAVACKWYEESDLSWSSDGCNTSSTMEDSGKRKTTCECNHMTSFAIIMSVEDVDASQDAFSNVMLIINIICCLLTLLCIAPFKVFRQKKLMFIQMQILLCLVALSTALLVLGNKSFLPQPELNKGCKALAFIIHYLLISLFAWSVCAAFTLKDQIVDALKSYGRKDDWYLTRCMIFCWGLPILMPAVTMILSNTVNVEDGYIRENHCWYTQKWLYGTVLLPIYLCFIIIIVWYVMVLRVIVNASRNGSAQGSNKKTLKAAFAIACTVGLPWVIHPFVPHKAVATVMQWFFMISVGLQGLGIFICAVLLQDEVLSKVCHTLRVTPPSFLMKKKTYKKKTEPKNPTKSTDSMIISRQGNTTDRIYSSELVTVGQSMPDHTYNDLDASSSVINEEKPMPPPPAALTNDQAGLDEPHYEEFQPPFL